jgi:hypothetical protein
MHEGFKKIGNFVKKRKKLWRFKEDFEKIWKKFCSVEMT